jgi:hypothetical protein
LSQFPTGYVGLTGKNGTATHLALLEWAHAVG